MGRTGLFFVKPRGGRLDPCAVMSASALEVDLTRMDVLASVLWCQSAWKGKRKEFAD